MRPRNTALLALVFVALAAYIYFYEARRDRAPISRLLPDLKPEDITGIVLSYPRAEIRLRKDPSGRWTVTHPVQSSANPSAVSEILAALSTSEIRRSVEKRPGPQDLRAFGFDPFTIRVALTVHGEKALPPLLVGAETRLGNSVYVKREGKPEVFLSSASLRATLDKRLDDFRDQTTREVKPEEVQGPSLEGKK